MKKTLFSVLRTMCVGAMTLFAVSCYDDSALWGEVDRLDGRIDSLAAALNSQVEAINSKIGAVEEAYKAADADMLAKLQAGDAELAASLTALTTKLDGVDGKVDGYIESNDAALKAAAEQYQKALKDLEGKLTDADKALAEADADLLVKLAGVGIVKVEKKNGNAVLTFTDGTTLEVGAYDANANNEGLVTVVEDEDGVKYWAVVLADGTKKNLEVAVGHNDLQFQVDPATKELEYSVDGGANWTGTGAFVSTSKPIQIDFFQGETDEMDWETYEYIKEDFYTLVFGEETYYLPLYKVDNSVVSLKAGKTYFEYGESVTVDVVISDITSVYVMTKPDGWRASIDGKKLTVTAPAEEAVEAGYAESDGEVLLHATTSEGKCKIVKFVVATTPGFSLTVTEDGEVTIVNPEVVTRMQNVGWETVEVTDFNDAFVGLAEPASFEANPSAYVAGIQDNYDAQYYILSNWKNNTADYDDDWNPIYKIGGVYEPGVYEVDVIETTVPEMYADWTWGKEIPVKPYVVWACPIDENGMPRVADLVYAYYYPAIKATITEVDATTADVEVSINVVGATTYYVGLVTEEMTYGYPIDTYMQMSEGPFGMFQQYLQWAPDYAFEPMGTPFGGEYGEEMPETINASVLNYGQPLMPNTKFYMWVFPVVDGLDLADYTYEKNLKPYIYEFTTTDLAAGGSAVVEFGEENLQYTSMSVDLVATEGTTMIYYQWYDADAYNEIEDVTADLLENGMVLGGEKGTARNNGNVQPGASFVLAALAVDADGKYGEVAEDTFTAPEIEYSTTFTAVFGEETSEVYSPGFKYDFSVTVTGGTAAKYYYVFSTTEFSDEQLANLPLTHEYNYNFRSATSVNGLYANANSTYYLAVVVESEDGELAPVIKKTVTVPAVPAE